MRLSRAAIEELVLPSPAWTVPLQSFRRRYGLDPRALVVRAGAKQDIRDGIDWYREHGGRELSRRFFQVLRRKSATARCAPPTSFHGFQQIAGRFKRI